MALDNTRELLSIQKGMSGGYNRNSAKLILAEIFKVYDKAVVDQLIREIYLEKAFGLKPVNNHYLITILRAAKKPEKTIMLQI